MFNLLTDAPQEASLSSMLPSLGLFAILGIFFVFTVVMPQRKRDKEQKERLNNMKIGDTIITIGGVVGVLARITDDEITIFSSNANTPITFQKAAIQTVISRNADKAESMDKKDKKSKKIEE